MVPQFQHNSISTAYSGMWFPKSSLLVSFSQVFEWVQCVWVRGICPLQWSHDPEMKLWEMNCSLDKPSLWPLFAKWNIWLNAFSHFLLQGILILARPVGRFGADHNIFNQTYSTSYLWYAHRHYGDCFNAWILVTSCTRMKLSEDMRRHVRKCVIQFQILNEPDCNSMSLPNQ